MFSGHMICGLAHSSGVGMRWSRAPCAACAVLTPARGRGRHLASGDGRGVHRDRPGGRGAATGPPVQAPDRQPQRRQPRLSRRAGPPIRRTGAAAAWRGSAAIRGTHGHRVAVVREEAGVSRGRPTPSVLPAPVAAGALVRRRTRVRVGAAGHGCRGGLRRPARPPAGRHAYAANMAPTDSPLWILRMASPSSAATDRTDRPSHRLSAGTGTVSVTAISAMPAPARTEAAVPESRA